MCFAAVSLMMTLCDAYHKEFESHNRSILEIFRTLIQEVVATRGSTVSMRPYHEYSINKLAIYKVYFLLCFLYVSINIFE